MRVLLYYKYVAVADPVREKNLHQAFCEEHHIVGRIFISSEGINGTCAGSEENIQAYKAWMDAHEYFGGTQFKESQSDGPAFKKLIVRVRPELVTLRAHISAQNAASYITADELHAALSRSEDMVLVDMRNTYEAQIGRFKNAFIVPIRYFRELPDVIGAMQHLKNKPVVTYCTGGIRCEKASALLLEHGFTNVRQLEGGIVTYCEKYPDGFFEGTCFVFDERMAVRYETVPRVISNCTYCKAPCDRYIDCNDQHCNALFLCCNECKTETEGYCNSCAAGRTPSIANKRSI